MPAETVAETGDLEARNPGTDGGNRAIPAGEFFVDLLTTRLRLGEILTEVRVASAGERSGAACGKLTRPAAGFALAGAGVPTVKSPVMSICSDCGAVYASAEESCSARFDTLLALDHSRVEPWGSRHALAFSAFALQHPDRFARHVLERGWLLLLSVYEKGVSADKVTRALRRAGKGRPDWALPPLPPGKPAAPFAVTIADLGSFAAEGYAAQLDDWCRAALAGWRALQPH